MTCEYMAQQEGVLCEEVLLLSESNDDVCVKVKVHARVMGKVHLKLQLEDLMSYFLFLPLAEKDILPYVLLPSCGSSCTLMFFGVLLLFFLFTVQHHLESLMEFL